MAEIHIGKDISQGYSIDNEPFSIPLFHSFCSGITQHGKTTALKRMAYEASKQGLKVLLIDVKAKPGGERDFKDFGRNVPVFIKESDPMGVDPLAIKGLLESASKLRLNFQFPELIKACEKAFSLKQVYNNIDMALNFTKIHPIRKDKLEVLKLLLQRLVAELEAVPKSEYLDIVEGINVMNVTRFTDAFKQIVVKSVAEEVRMHIRDVLLVFDEAHIQLPQAYSSASKYACTKLIKEGAGSRQFVWLADQTVTEVDKDVLKQVEVWLLGRQRELNEAIRAFKQLPYREGLSIEEIMRLKVGEFYVATSDSVKKVYVHPLSEDELASIRPTETEDSEFWRGVSERLARMEAVLV